MFKSRYHEIFTIPAISEKFPEQKSTSRRFFFEKLQLSTSSSDYENFSGMDLDLVNEFFFNPLPIFFSIHPNVWQCNALYA